MLNIAPRRTTSISPNDADARRTVHEPLDHRQAATSRSTARYQIDRDVRTTRNVSVNGGGNVVARGTSSCTRTTMPIVSLNAGGALDVRRGRGRGRHRSATVAAFGDATVDMNAGDERQWSRRRSRSPVNSRGRANIVNVNAGHERHARGSRFAEAFGTDMYGGANARGERERGRLPLIGDNFEARMRSGGTANVFANAGTNFTADTSSSRSR